MMRQGFFGRSVGASSWDHPRFFMWPHAGRVAVEELDAGRFKH